MFLQMTSCPSKTSKVKADENAWLHILNAVMKEDEYYRHFRKKTIQRNNQANIYLSIVNNRNTRKKV